MLPTFLGRPIAFPSLLTVVVSALLASSPLAQSSKSQPPAVANPKATSAPLAYRSVFERTPTGVEADSDNWREANDQVGRYLRGHPDILKAEESKASSKQASPAVPAASQPAANRHKH
jgi:hypothetical protein